MDKITVVCHKDHEKGYEDYAGVCLLCEIERLQKREWVGLTDEEVFYLAEYLDCCKASIRNAEAKLKEKNT